MRDFKKKFAQELILHHPGIPNDDVAVELIDSFFITMRKFLLRENTLMIEGIGVIDIKNVAGSRKRDARYDITYDVSPRKIVKLKVSDGFKKIINVDRQPSKRVEEPE